MVKDYLKIQYDKGDTLYVPVTQLDLVSKYIGTKDEDRRSSSTAWAGQEWQKAKTRVRAAVRDIAKELIALYGKRMARRRGYAFDPDGEWQYDFERAVRIRGNGGPAPLHRGNQGGHGAHRADGSAAVRGRGLRQDGGGAARGVQMRVPDASSARCWCPPPSWRCSTTNTVVRRGSRGSR